MSRTPILVCAIAFLLLPVTSHAQRIDPQTAFLFGLKVNNVNLGGSGEAFFKSITGLGSETEVVDYMEGGQNTGTRKIPGTTRFLNITLKRGFTNDLSLVAWRKLVEEGKFQSAQQDAFLVLYDKQGREIARWKLLKVWPARVWVHTELDGKGEDVPVEEIEIAVEKVERG